MLMVLFLGGNLSRITPPYVYFGMAWVSCYGSFIGRAGEFQTPGEDTASWGHGHRPPHYPTIPLCPGGYTGIGSEQDQMSNRTVDCSRGLVLGIIEHSNLSYQWPEECPME